VDLDVPPQAGQERQLESQRAELLDQLWWSEGAHVAALIRRRTGAFAIIHYCPKRGTLKASRRALGDDATEAGEIPIDSETRNNTMDPDAGLLLAEDLELPAHATVAVADGAESHSLGGATELGEIDKHATGDLLLGSG
jgi:hypothetical protein